MDSNYELLVSKINSFTRKFYLNKLLRGLIYSLALLLTVYLLLFLLVYYLHPGVLVKTLLFFFFLLVSAIAVFFGMIKPLLAYFSITKTLSLEESAILIGNHFEPIKDKLLNTLQLKTLAAQPKAHTQLIMAGIAQKVTELNPIPFSAAIQLGENKRYIKFVLAPLAVIFLIGILAPAVWREGSRSFIQYDREILPPSPFNFELRNQTLTVTQGDDLLIDVELTGNELPQEVYLAENVNAYKLEKKVNSRFSYTFKNLQQNKSFRFSAGGFKSKEFTVVVKPRPSILNIAANLVYPAYLKKKNEVVANAGDLLLPEGTIVTWNINTENAKNVIFKLDAKSHMLAINDRSASFKAQLRKSQSYQVVPKNDFAVHPDSIMHRINVIADQFPVILVNEKADSLSRNSLYFTGNISDDHGFSSLKFIYLIKENGKEKKRVSTSLPIDAAKQQNSYFYYWNLAKISLQAGEELTYFLEVSDNDQLNGFKKSRSAMKTYSPPSQQELAKQQNAEGKNLKNKMDAAIKLAAEVEKDSKKLGQALLDKKDLSFENKKEVSQLLDKQKKLEQMVDEIQQAKKKNSIQQQENDKMNTELAEKQQKIDELFNHVLDPKTKALLEKLQRLMDQNNKDSVQYELSKMNMDNKSLKTELDRILELYKQLEFEQNLQNKIDRLNTLAEEQLELSKKSMQKNADLNALKQQQDKKTDDFNALKKELRELNDKNQALERPNSFAPMEKESEAIQQRQQLSKDMLQKNQQQKAADMQKDAAEKIQQMAKQMDESREESAEMENKLNTEELRLLLQHLLQTSFDQEKVMTTLKKISASDPLYNRNVQQQRVIKDNMKTIADSLAILSKRIPQIESTVTTEMRQINFNLDKSLNNLGERRTAEAAKNQQYTMSGINNLALMLNEALEQLEKNKKKGKSGGKGKGGQSMQQLQKMQEQLNKNMEQARQQMQKKGNKGSVPKGKMSEGFAKMAQQQQMIREALQRINSEEKGKGAAEAGKLNELVKQMKLTEDDLLNKKIEEETMRRQQQLSNRMLDAQNAMREQDQDSKREAQAAKDFPPSYPKLLEEFRKNKSKETEFLQKLPPTLNYYYKNRIADYFKSLNSPN